ncbi:hypothetical protein OAH85_12460, partial [Paracoccaceae bacterium]|nr:hypothetical protein [Paracoccaceae bacterium]
ESRLARTKLISHDTPNIRYFKIQHIIFWIEDVNAKDYLTRECSKMTDDQQWQNLVTSWARPPTSA